VQDQSINLYLFIGVIFLLA